MTRFILLVSFVLLLAGTGLAEPADPRLPDWEVRDGENDDQILREVLSSGYSLLGVVISETAENGEEQLQALLRTQAELEAEGIEGIRHLHVIAGAPRLVHGLIRRGIRGSYDDSFSRENILMAFTSDHAQWLERTGLEVTEQPLWLWLDSNGRIVWAERDTGTETASHLLVRIETE